MSNYSIQNKILSGRFWLTITAALSFLILISTLSYILTQKKQEIETQTVILLITNLTLVIQSVFTAYFNKRRYDIDGLNDEKINK